MPHLLEVEGLTTVFDSDYGRTVKRAFTIKAINIPTAIPPK